jgi:hypothetical protein
MIGDHRLIVLKHQEALARMAKRPAQDRMEPNTADPLESIAISLKRIADAMREEPNRG